MVDGLSVVSIKKLNEERKGKKVKVDVILEGAGKFEKGLVVDSNVHQAAGNDRRNTVLAEIKKWNDRNGSGSDVMCEAIRKKEGVFSFGDEKNAVSEGCGGWPEVATRGP